MDDRFSLYVKNVPQPLRPIEEGETEETLKAAGVSVWDGDVVEMGGMVAQNPKNLDDQWYVGKAFFEENYIPYEK